MKKRLPSLLLCAVLTLAMLPAALALDFNDSSNYSSANGDGFTPYGVEWKDGAGGIITFQSQKDSYDNAVFVISLYRDGKQVGTHEESAGGGTTHTVKLLDYMPAAGLYEVMVHLSVDSVVKGKLARGNPYQKGTSNVDPDLIQPGFGSTAEEDAGKYFPCDIDKITIAYSGCTHDMSFENGVGVETCHALPVVNYAAGSGDPRSGPGWSYDPTTTTLSLNNFHGTAIYLSGPLAYHAEHKTPTINLKLTGDNVLTDNGKQLQGPLQADRVNLVISGPGSLTLNGGKGGFCSSHNNGDYKEKTLDGGLVTLKNGVNLRIKSSNQYGQPLSLESLTIGTGCVVDLDGSTLKSAGFTENLVVNGTLIARSSPTGTVKGAINTAYCTVGTNVTVKGGMDAASATVMKTMNLQTSPIYGQVTTLDYDYSQTYPYMEFREGGAVLPETPTTPSAPTAFASTQTITLDGKPVEFQAYALKDGNGNETNYVKLRDVAFAMMDSGVQFNVGWDGAVNILPGETYKPNGSEMTTPFTGDRAYTMAAAPTKFGGVDMNLEAIILTDDEGAGYTYYKFRDLGKTLGFQVDWSATTGITVNTAGG